MQPAQHLIQGKWQLLVLAVGEQHASLAFQWSKDKQCQGLNATAGQQSYSPIAQGRGGRRVIAFGVKQLRHAWCHRISS